MAQFEILAQSSQRDYVLVPMIYSCFRLLYTPPPPPPPKKKKKKKKKEACRDIVLSVSDTNSSVSVINKEYAKFENA